MYSLGYRLFTINALLELCIDYGLYLIVIWVYDLLFWVVVMCLSVACLSLMTWIVCCGLVCFMGLFVAESLTMLLGFTFV